MGKRVKLPHCPPPTVKVGNSLIKYSGGIMNFVENDTDVVFQELPGHISLTFSISGCGKKCPGCHSPYLQSCATGKELTEEIFKSYIKKYEGFISAVVFFNGDMHTHNFVELLDIAHEHGLKTCLYTGLKMFRLKLSLG